MQFLRSSTLENENEAAVDWLLTFPMNGSLSKQVRAKLREKQIWILLFIIGVKQ